MPCGTNADGGARGTHAHIQEDCVPHGTNRMGNGDGTGMGVGDGDGTGMRMGESIEWGWDWAVNGTVGSI